MTKPKKTDGTLSKHLMLPGTLVARTELELFSDLEGKVPMGAWQKLLIKLLEEHWDRVDRHRKKADKSVKLLVSSVDGIPTSILNDDLQEKVKNAAEQPAG
jgi:hypothetical protein